MEDLTKNQIVLLTLLVSFVTSIATGVITTSLLAEAPQSVTQTINRVVEHTIEKVAPTATSTKETVKEVTVVKEEDAIINSIDKSVQAVVRIRGPVGLDGSQGLYALGVVVSKDGLVLTDKRLLVSTGSYTVTLQDGSVLPATLLQYNENDNLVLFRIKPDQAHVTFRFAPISTTDLKLGQTIIALLGRDKNSIAIGRVTSSSQRTEKDAKVTYSVMTDINPANEIQGSPLFNLSGELVGLKTSLDDLSIPDGTYTTSIPLKKTLEKAG